jgi:streptogramin lyase
MVIKIRELAAILLLEAAILIPWVDSNAQVSVFPAALTGQVASREEGPMEGVVVSAKRAGSTVTVTVVTDQQGRYSFPRSRLEAGRYTLRARAAGYDLEDRGPVDITPLKTSSLDLKLRRTQDLAAQLTNAEWLMSLPGTDEQKSTMQCSLICHTVERIVRSHYNAAEFVKVIQRMGTYDSSSLAGFIQLRPEVVKMMNNSAANREEAPLKGSAALAQCLSTVNLSSGPWKYSLNTLPRPKGKATHVIITQYDLPRQFTEPHDITVDSEGKVWYCDYGQPYLGRLDPATSKVDEYPIPVLKPDYSKGGRTVEFDPQGNIWIAMNEQGFAGRFDQKTEKFQIFSVPKSRDSNEEPRVSDVQPGHSNVDGKLWAQTPRGTQNRGGTEQDSVTSGIQWRLQRMDVKSGEWEDPIDPFKDIPKNSRGAGRTPFIYHIYVDSQNNVYFGHWITDLIGKVEAKTRKVTYYQTPTNNSGPRRGHFDHQDRLWFGEDKAGRIAMFDPKTEKFSGVAASHPIQRCLRCSCG